MPKTLVDDDDSEVAGFAPNILDAIGVVGAACFVPFAIAALSSAVF